MDLMGERLKQAASLLIRDQEGRYEECIVEGFVDLLNTVGPTVNPVLIEIYSDAEFADQNHSRLFRFQQALCEYNHERNVSSIESCEHLWSRLPQVVARNDTSEIKAVLPLLSAIVTDRTSFDWIVNKQLNQSGRIDDIVTLARHFLTSSRNYHIQNLASSLMADLLKQSSKHHNHLASSHRFFRSLKRNIEELLEECNPGIYYVLDEALSNYYRTVFRIIDRFNLEDTLRLRLDEAIKRGSVRDINCLSKCLSLAKVEEDLLVEKLEQAGQLEAIILFAMHIHRDFLCHTWLTHYIVYPILLGCQNKDNRPRNLHAEELIAKLLMPRDKMLFVRKYMQPKHVIQCLQYLKRSLSCKERHIDDGFNQQPKRKFIMILDVLLEYVRSNFHESCHGQDLKFKSVMDCCSTLRIVQERFTRRSETMWLYKLMLTAFDLLEPLRDPLPSRQKSLVLEMIRLMSYSLRKLTMFTRTNFVVLNYEFRVKICQWAMRFTDSAVLQEVGALFKKCEFDFDSDPEHSIFVDLAWGRMYSLAREQEDRDLLAISVVLLPSIDIKANDATLKKAGLIRYKTIPRILADLLIDLRTDDKTIEMISRIITSHYPKEADNSQGIRVFSGTSTSKHGIPPACYVNFVCKHGNVPCKEHWARALCVAVRRDLHHSFQLSLLKSLSVIIDGYVNNLDFLRKTGILETLEFIHENLNYLQTVRATVCGYAGRLKSANPSLKQTYCGPGASCATWERHQFGTNNKLGMDAYIDQILNQTNTLSFDCY